MKVPMRWLADYVETGLTARELAHRMTMAGLEAEKIEDTGAGWDRVFVGLVRGVSRHPDADRLVLADVQAGEHRLTVVTGAPNIAEGQKVALALAGARLVDAYNEEGGYKVLKPGTIRGIRSEGMVCSEKELGMSDEHEGILVLPGDAPVGRPLRDYLGDYVIEFEITPNLVHAFSVRGIAREAAALLAVPCQEQPAVPAGALTPVQPGLVTIDAPDLCARYMGIVIDGVQVGPSPDWMASRLNAAGVRPINNIVDITNYVMLELGQPLHAFDLRNVHGERIIVRRAHDGEQMETLDHTLRTLTPENLVIADETRAVAIAGVMGGVDSEVANDTTTILLEGANFNMTSVRHTARALKLRTDASGRFERGIDPNLVDDAMRRATYLILELCPGATIRAVNDVYPAPLERRTVRFDFARIERLLGMSFTEEHVNDVLSRLDMEPSINDENGSRVLTVSPPTYRQDVTLREDVIEEVARISGYELLPETLPTGTTAEVARDRTYRVQEQVRATLVGSGLYEAVTYVTIGESDVAPFVDEQGNIGLATTVAADAMLRVINPLQAEKPFLRTTLIPSLLAIVRENLKHASSVRFFELARAYVPTTPDELPHEVNLLSIVMAGAREQLNRFGETGEIDIFDLKGVLEESLERLGVMSWSLEQEPHVALHPGRSAAVKLGSRRIGWIGEVRPDVAANLGFDVARVAVAEIDLDAVIAAIPVKASDRTVPRFLPVEQDFAIIVDESTPAGNIEEVLRAAAGPLASDFKLFDIYRGPQIGEGKKSLAYRITFTAPDRALTDADLGKVRNRIEKSLKQRVSGTLRG